MMKKINLVISILLMCVMFAGTLKTAEAAEYEPKEMQYAFTCYEQYYSYGNNLIVLNNDDDYYSDKYDKTCNKVIIDTISSEDEKADRKEFVCKNKKTYAFKVENNNVYTYVEHGNNKIVIQVRNQNGKVKGSYPIKINKKNSQKIKNMNIEDATIKDSKMYYVLNVTTKKDKEYNYFQCYNLKKKKVISSKKLKNGGMYEFDSGKLYFYNYGSTIKEYALNGKRTSSYKLPEGETSVTGHLLHLNGLEYEYSFKAVDYNRNCIYYCNRNGVYRCDTKGDGVFKLIYNGSNDAVFNPAYGQEKMLEYFKVLDNGNFYVVTDNYEHSAARGFIYKKP